jgi:hypothetical protein
LAGISTPQTLKIEGYIKKKKVIVLIDSGSTHNFIHYKLAKALNCFVYPVPELRGITGKPDNVISSNGMKQLLKKGHQGVIAQLFSLDVQTSKPSIPQYLQRIIDKHSKVFEDIPKGLPTIRNHDHEIHLIPGSVPPNIRPYRYPYTQKSEIERMVEEMLEVGIIRPRQSSYSAPVVMVFKKDNSWRMCPDYREINKITIKHKFPIPIIDELLDELYGAIYFTKLDLHSGYHQIRMKEDSELMKAIMNFWSCLLALQIHLTHSKG